MTKKEILEILEILEKGVTQRVFCNISSSEGSVTYDVVNNIQSAEEFTVLVTDDFELAKEIADILHEIGHEASISVVKHITSWPYSFNY